MLGQQLHQFAENIDGSAADPCRLPCSYLELLPHDCITTAISTHLQDQLLVPEPGDLGDLKFTKIQAREISLAEVGSVLLNRRVIVGPAQVKDEKLVASLEVAELEEKEEAGLYAV